MAVYTRIVESPSRFILIGSVKEKRGTEVPQHWLFKHSQQFIQRDIRWRWSKKRPACASLFVDHLTDDRRRMTITTCLNFACKVVRQVDVDCSLLLARLTVQCDVLVSVHIFLNGTKVVALAFRKSSTEYCGIHICIVGDYVRPKTRRGMMYWWPPTSHKYNVVGVC